MNIQKVIYFTPTELKAEEVLNILKDKEVIKGSFNGYSTGAFDFHGENSHHVEGSYKEIFSPAYLSHQNRKAIEKHWKGIKDHEHGFDENYKIIFYYNIDVYENSVCAFQFEPYDVCENVNGRKQRLDIQLDDPYFMRRYHGIFLKLQELGWNPVTL